ncbi:MAG: DUF4226 domain-containing protein [Mycobacterium sp.]
MSEEAGPAASAIAATQQSLAARHSDLVAADEVLLNAVTEAHSITVESLHRLDVVGAEIESAVARQHLLALDSPAGALDFQRFLLGRHHEIIRVVTEAMSRADAAAGRVRDLTPRYGG